MGREKIEEAYVEIKVDGLDNVKNLINQSKQATQTFNSTLGDTQKWIDKISGQMAGLKSSIQGSFAEPLDRLQRAAQQVKSLTAVSGSGAVPLSAKSTQQAPTPQAPTVRENDLLDESMGVFDDLPKSDFLKKLDDIKAKISSISAPGQLIEGIVEDVGRNIEALDLSNIDSLRKGLEGVSSEAKKLLASFGYDETNDAALELLGTLRRIDSLTKSAMPKSGRAEFDPFAGQQEFSFPKPPPPPGPPSAGDRAAEFVENLNRRNEERIEMIRELTALYDDMARKESAVANATKDRIDALQKEHKAYNEGRYSESQQMAAGLIDAEKKRIEKISELKTIQQSLTATDTRAAAAVNKKIEALKNEQKAYESGGRGMLGNIMANIREKTANFREKAGALRGAVAGPTGGGIRGAMGGGVSGITQLVTRSMGPAMAAASAGLAAIASVVAPVAAAMTALNGVLIAAPAAFVGAAYAISKFTDAINPGLTMQLNMVMRDMTAIIGTALNPILQTMVPIIRDFADRMLPIARELGVYFKEMMVYLEPVMKAFNVMYQAIVGALMPSFKLVGDVFVVLAQIVGALMEVISGVLAPFRTVAEALYVVLSPAIEAIKVLGQWLVDSGRNFRVLSEAFQFMLKSFAKMLGLDSFFDDSKKGWQQIGQAMHRFANNVLMIAARIAKFFGLTSFVEGMINSLSPKGGSTGLAAAQNPQFQSIESLGKNMSLQAAIATSGAAEETDQQKADKEMLEQLKAIQQNGPDIVNAIKDLPAKLAEAIANGAKKATSFVKEAASAPVDLVKEGSRYMSEVSRGKDLDAKLAAMNRKRNDPSRFVQG